MTILELGALGELVAALGVIASLVYVGFQIRQNTRATNGTAIAQVASESQRNLVAITQDDLLAGAVTKVMAGEDALSPLERTKLFFWFTSMLRGIESHILQVKLGTLPSEHEEPWIRILTQLRAYPFYLETMRQYPGTRTFQDWLAAHVTGAANP